MTVISIIGNSVRSPEASPLHRVPRMEPTDAYTAIQVIMMPSDANPYGTIFGGVILSYIDMAGSIGARREILLKGGVKNAGFVTVAMNRVEFKHPVMIGDVVKFQTVCTRIGRTSITMKIDVFAERGTETIFVTEAEVVFVGVDTTLPVEQRRPMPLLPTV